METLFVMSCGCKLTKNETKKVRFKSRASYYRVCKQHKDGKAISKICFCQFKGCKNTIKKDLKGRDVMWCPTHKKAMKNAQQRKANKTYDKKGNRPERKQFKKSLDRCSYCKLKCKNGNIVNCENFVPLFANYDPGKMIEAKR